MINTTLSPTNAVVCFLVQPLLAEFNKEQEAFIRAKGGKPGQAVAPWVGYPQEEALKEEILALSTVSHMHNLKQDLYANQSLR